MDYLNTLTRELGVDLDDLSDHQVHHLGMLLRRRLEAVLGPAASQLEQRLQALGNGALPEAAVPGTFQEVLSHLLGPAASTFLKQQCVALGFKVEELPFLDPLELAIACRKEIQHLLGESGLRRYDNELILFCGLDPLRPRLDGDFSDLIVDPNSLPTILREVLAEVAGPAATQLLSSACRTEGVSPEQIAKEHVIPLAVISRQLLQEMVDRETSELFTAQFRAATGLDLHSHASRPPPQSQAGPGPALRHAPAPTAPDAGEKKAVRTLRAIRRPRVETDPDEMELSDLDGTALSAIYAQDPQELAGFPANYELENFIVSSANEGAYRKILGVLQKEQTAMPILITGEAGTGKTHLFIGFARELVRRLSPGEGLLYLSLPSSLSPELHLAQKDGVSVLFIANLHECPRELLPTLVHVLLESKKNGKIVVCSSDKPLNELDSLLRIEVLSRGSHVALDVPDDELRGEVVAQVVAQHNLSLSEEQIKQLVAYESDLNLLSELAVIAAEGGPESLKMLGDVIQEGPKKVAANGKAYPTSRVDPYASPQYEMPALPSHLNRFSPDFVFDSFVEGGSNRMASQAAQAVAQAPGEHYNPLFIYGGVGLGKTHLMHAIGNRLSNKRVILTSCKDMVDDFMRALKDNSLEEFRNTYRSAEVLMIDDIQFLRDRAQLQEEYFALFNMMIDGSGQVVMTSDKPPNELEGIEDRLTSRFQMGLTVDISPPELETREAILAKLSSSKGWDVSMDILHFISNAIEDNIRELRGALTRVMAQAQFGGRAVDLDLAREVLGPDLAQPPTTAIPGPSPPPSRTPQVRIPTLYTQEEMESLTSALDPGQAYLFKEEDYGESDAAFAHLVKAKRPALAISRSSPESLAMRLGLEVGEFQALWLTQTSGQDSLDPTDLELLARRIRDFVARNEVSSGVILFQGLEYLATHNDFQSLLKMIQSMKDRITMHKATLLVSISPDTLDIKELKSLEREFNVVK